MTLPRTALLLFPVLASIAPLAAQTAGLAGIFRDPSGAIVARANVTAIERQRSLRDSAATGQSGVGRVAQFAPKVWF